MAASVSKWTSKGSNTNASIASVNPGDASDSMDIIVRHEMHIWLDDDSAITSDPFGWKVDKDFMIAFNVTKVDLTNTIGNCTATIEGSVDGTNYVTLKSLGTTTFDAAVVAYVYDVDANGVLPYMRFSVTPATDVDNTAKPIKVVVWEYNRA
ncbi:hypothetical protein CMI37_28200 [Candidatus Pacearchaeota archaeon]|nr:hypothetical protein [Candidatus Pacearchaeota archaeon]|tara:strand:- start:80 stop:535 length:456 start_codon:yes stop_codon:yes gene_type:complete